MRTMNLQEWLQRHWATAEAEEEGETSDPEGRDRWNEDRRDDGGDEREQIKWEMVVELI